MYGPKRPTCSCSACELRFVVQVKHDSWRIRESGTQSHRKTSAMGYFSPAARDKACKNRFKTYMWRLAQSVIGSKDSYGVHQASHKFKSFGHCRWHIPAPCCGITSIPHSHSAQRPLTSEKMEDDTSEAADVPSLLRNLLSAFFDHVSAL
jgi:hypothetical protein